jgi:wyosine [tRNA(Phe)-imidazoG37] synthetase (radical SAM superfamily)
MGTGPCGIEILKKRKGKRKFIRFNIITYYNDFMEAVKKYRSTLRGDKNLQKAFDQRMNGKQRLL